VQYFLDEDRHVIFTITQDEYRVNSVPHPEPIHDLVEGMVRSLRRINQQEFLYFSSQLYDLLIKPVEELIVGEKHLVIIPDDILHNVPFDALLKSTTEIEDRIVDFSTLDYLVTRHAISTHYSATLYLHTLKQAEHRKRLRSQLAMDDGFLGFAPVFRDAAHRVDSIPEPDITDITRLFSIDSRLVSELPYSEEEVYHIVKLFKQHGKPATAYFHTQASKEAFLENAGQYRIIHVASHGYINNENPDLSGVMFYQEDTNGSIMVSMLFTGEMYNLDLNADLVVLSSCDSAVGQLIKGEGLMAMTRGLLYSGASNVIVSLWKVYDRYTKDFMVEFYDRYIEGEPSASALREAKLTLISNETTAFPYIWSSFVLIGK